MKEENEINKIKKVIEILKPYAVIRRENGKLVIEIEPSEGLVKTFEEEIDDELVRQIKKTMKLYKISQNVNTDYDTYDSAVVCAKDEEAAKRIHPMSGEKGGGIYRENAGIFYDEDKKQFLYCDVEDEDGDESCEAGYGSWISDLSEIKVEYLGEAKEGSAEGVVVASFNAG